MNELGEIVPHFENAPESLIEDFKRQRISKVFKKGTSITLEGDQCIYFPIVKSGVVRVYMLGNNGQEITLYRIEPGESCILTISCLLSNKNFPAYTYVEKDSEILLVANNVLKEWVSKYDSWAQYIYNYLSSVLINVLNLIDDLTFKRTDTRIYEYLIENYVKHGKVIKTTHKEIAYDLGTAREVVSRILKELESEILITIHRGEIVVKDIDAIKRRVKYLQ